jgi:ankyrin repeat protein
MLPSAQLLQAIHNDDAAAIHRLIDEGLDPKKRLDRWSERTPLDEATNNKKYQAAKALMARGGAKSNEHLLHVAVVLQDFDAAAGALDAGADVNSKFPAIDIDGETPLYIACKNDRPDIVAFLLGRGADPNVPGSFEGKETALHQAARSSPRSFVLLVEAGASHEAEGHRDATPLFGACAHGHVDIVRFCLDRGVAINRRDKYGYTALMEACMFFYLRNPRLTYPPKA